MNKKSDKIYLVIEEIGNIFRVSNILMDQDKNIKLLNIKEISSLDELKKPRGKKPNIILALDSNHATTIEKKIKIERSSPHNKIDEGEMDQLIFKTLWTFLDKYRNWSAKKMNITDLNIVLSEIEIKNASLDSKNILNPVGFKGKNIVFRIKGTLIPRDCFKYIKKVKNIGEKVKIIERLSVVTSFCPKGDFQVHVGSKLTGVFSLTENEIKYKKKYSWGVENIINSIINLFSVEKEVAIEIIKKYFNNKLSKNIFGIVDKEIKRTLKLFQKDIRGITKKRKIKIFVNIPFSIYKKSLDNLSTIKHLNLFDELERKGFNVIIKSSKGIPYFKKVSESMIIAGSELFSLHYSELNKILKRRSKWLIPHI